MSETTNDDKIWKIGDKVKIRAPGPANAYHRLDGDSVEIIGISDYKDSKKVYTFFHSQAGFGAMYAHGFEK